VTSSCEFAINGRFLSQPVTGVQRYARNVVAAMSATLADGRGSAQILVPSSVTDTWMAAMPVTAIGPLTGHAWEQTTLPLRWRGRLLNLGNTAPVLKTDQVVCIHDANVFVAPESYAPSFRLTYTTVQNMVARRSARLATVSSDSARQIARYLSVRAADIAVLPNGHEHALAWDPTLAQIGQESVNCLAKSSRRFVLALGSRARHKNMQLVFDIAPLLDKLGLDVIIAGGGDSIYATEVLSKAPNVKTLGYVTDHDLAYLMNHAICLVFPSWTEGFGLPIVEAMARGCPVISSDRASMPEVCGNAALMAPPDDRAAWVRHIKAVAQSDELRRDLVGSGHEQVLRFSWSQTAAGYLELMRAPMSRPRGQRQEIRECSTSPS
jgi:glycosyltransferase involved in cell wall biosynthesis